MQTQRSCLDDFWFYVPVEQSSGWFTEIGDDTAQLQATSHRFVCSLMAFVCQEIKGLLNYLLTYLLTYLLNLRPICSTSDVSTNRRNIHHRPALLWRFS